MTLLNTEEAAPLLGVTRSEVGWLAKTGRLPARRNGRIWLIESSDIEAFVDERGRWISMTQAARLTGLTRSAVVTAVRAGEIEQRPGIGVASLARNSVLKWADAYRRVQAERDAVCANAASRRQEAAAAKRPPDDGNTWLGAREAAEVLGITQTRVNQMARADRIPHIVRGHARFFRRADVDRLAAARAFSAAMRQARAGTAVVRSGDL